MEQARHVLSAAEGMESRMRDYARAQTTVSIGSCAPGPMWALTPELTATFPEKTITAEMKEPETLLSGLLAGKYQLVVTDVPVEQPGVLCKRYLTEQLYISLPPAHPLAAKKGIYLSDLEGQTMLLYSDLGVWHKLREDKMGGIHFIIQTEREAFTDLISASVLPNFTSDLTRRMSPPPMDRVDIPILDSDATITFYLCAKEKQKKLWESISAR